MQLQMAGAACGFFTVKTGKKLRPPILRGRAAWENGAIL
jgi:hypothetical protein